MAFGGIFGGIDTLIWGKNADKVYGKKLVTPPLKTLTESQAEALAGNAKNFEAIAKQAAGINVFNQEQLNKLTDMQLGVGAREQIQKNLQAGLRGELPPDVISQINQYNASRGGALTRNSPFLNNAASAQLGINSLQQTNQALTSAEQWLAASRAPLADITKAFINTGDQYQANIDQYNQALTQAKIAAAPDPAARGQFDSTMALLGMVLSAYGGGPGYTNTYRQNVEGLNDGGQFGASQGGGGWYVPQTSAGFGSSYFGGLAGAAQSAGASNPYSYGGYNLSGGGGGGGGLGKLF